MNALTDRDLLARARHGGTDQADAFGELVTRPRMGVFNICYRFDLVVGLR